MLIRLFYIFFFSPNSIYFFCSTIVAAAVSVAILLRYSLLNFVSFVNSNKLSIVLNMCYSWSQYTMHKTLEQFLKIFKYLRDENTIHTEREREEERSRVKHNECEQSASNNSNSSLVGFIVKMTYGQIGAYIIIHEGIFDSNRFTSFVTIRNFQVVLLRRFLCDVFSCRWKKKSMLQCLDVIKI